MTTTHAPLRDNHRLPVTALLALASAGFLAILTEAIPAGMLFQISGGLNVSEALAGQFVTLYAIGSLVAAIPLTIATGGWRRRPLILAALAGLLVFNTITALASSYTLSLIARLLAGMAAGLIWGILAGYARRMVGDSLKGRALAVAGIGAPLALALGIPAGNLFAGLIGWRETFGLISLMTLLAMIWVGVKVPDYSGQASEKRMSLGKVATTPGVMPVMVVLLLWVLAHNILYTYIMPFLVPAGLADHTDRVLLLFGIASLLGIWACGLLIDRILRAAVLGSLALFALVAVALGLWGTQAIVVYLAIAIWGFTFGGSATLLQTASAEAAGPGADVAQSILVTTWNIAIAAGGIAGGLLLDNFGVISFPWVIFALLTIGLLVAWNSSQYGFPSGRRAIMN